MSLLATITAVPVHVRRLMVRRPWLRVVPPLLLGTVVFAAVERADDAAVATQRQWGEPATVWVATGPAEPGDRLAAERREVPAAFVPDGAAVPDRDVAGLTVRRSVQVGEVIVDSDIDDRLPPLALVPDGWLVVPVIESPASGAHAGEYVVVASDGIVLADDAVVVEAGGDRTLIAVASADAPTVAFAASSGGPGVVLLRTGR